MACRNCGDRVTLNEYCLFCSKLYFKGETLRTTTREKPEKEVKKKVEKCCPVCKKEFVPKQSPRQKYCSAECRPRELTAAEKWINKKPRGKQLDSDQVAYNFFRKKYGVSNVYKVCRG